MEEKLKRAAAEIKSAVVCRVEGKLGAYALPEDLLRLYGRAKSLGIPCKLKDVNGYGYVVVVP